MDDILATESMQWNRTIHTETLRAADSDLADMVDSGTVDPAAVARVRDRLQQVMVEMQGADGPQ